MPCYWCPRAGARAVHWRCLSYVSFLLCSSCRPPFSGFRAQLTRRLDSGLLEFRAAAQPAQTTVRFTQSTHRKRTTHSGWPPDGFGNAGRPPAATLTASRRRVIFSASRFVQPGERCSFPTTDVSSQDECGLPMAAQRIAAGGETENRRRESKHPRMYTGWADPARCFGTVRAHPFRGALRNWKLQQERVCLLCSDSRTA